jgi:hypothetical protein
MLTYKEKIVCFIDILGFGEMVERKYLNDPTTIYSILSEIKTSIIDWVGTPIASKIDLQITLFSDCIVFSFVPDRHYFMTFNFLKELSIKMIMKYKVLFRGGITYGKVVHDSEVIFGPAMNCAYWLESEEAGSPRIVIDKKALSLKNEDDKTIADYPGQFVFKLTENGYSYIDYIVDVNGYLNQADYYNILRSIITKGLESPKLRVKEKYEWMRDEYNRAKANYQDLVPIEV